MNHWPFIIAAYAFTVLASAGAAFWAYSAMRRAEKLADQLRRDR